MNNTGSDRVMKRFMWLRYEDSSYQIGETMEAIYPWLGMQPPEGIDYPGVYSPKLAYKPADRCWIVTANLTGLTTRSMPPSYDSVRKP